jgi:hypothetical protein
MKWPISSIVGIMLVPVSLIFILISYSFFPTFFSPLQNYMSDLGNYKYNPNGAIYFNIGTIAGGGLMIVFFVGLYPFYTKKKTNKRLLLILQIIGAFSGFTSIMAGAFSEDYWDMHIFWSVCMFFSGILTSLIGGFFLYRQADSIKILVFYNILAACFSIIFLCILSYGLFIFEWFIFLISLINIVLTSLNYAHIYKEREK